MSAMLGDIKNAFDVLGIGVDSVIGRILGGMAAAAAAGQRLAGAIPKIVTTQNGKTTSKSDFGALFRGGEDGTTSAQKAEAGVAAIAGIASVWKATEADTKAKAAAQGAMAGAAFGAQFGVWGAVAGAAIGGLLGLFRANPAWVRIAREVGAMFGTTISKEMAEAIQKTAKDLKLNVSSASLLHLTEIADASGKGLRSYSAQILDLMDRVNKKQIPMKEGMDQIGKAWSMVRSEADKYEIVGDRVTVQMLKQARAMGMMTAEMKAFVSGKLDSAATGLEKLWSTPTGKKPTASGDVSGTITGGLAPKTEGEARDQATIFSAVFWATVKEKGVVAAADAMREQFAAMKAVLEATGFDASAIVGPMEQMMGLTENEKFRGAAEGVGALDAALKGLADTGYLTTDSFAAIERQAGSAFQQAVAGGLEAGLTQAQAEQQALMAIAPLLQSLQSTAAQYGVELDANTQSLIAQAEASGIAFKTDPTLMLIESINALITTLGGVPPAFNDMAGAGAAASSSTSSSFADAMASMPPAAKTAVMAVDESMVSITTSATLHFSDMQSGWQESMDAMAPAAEVAIEDVRTWLDTLPASATVPINFPLNFPPKPGVNNDGSSDYDGDPTTPYASGGIARGPASGYGVTLHGSEAVIPLGRPSGIASELSALIATAVSQGLGNVKTGQQTIILQIGQEVFKKVIESGTRGGTIRVHKNAIGEF
jgi:gas vesicle protein